MFAVILPLPKDETEQKAIVKDPQKFMAKKVAEGWAERGRNQRNNVVRAAIGHVPHERLMKIRWVLTFKHGPEEGAVKAKARLVVLGYSDPDAGDGGADSCCFRWLRTEVGE